MNSNSGTWNDTLHDSQLLTRWVNSHSDPIVWKFWGPCPNWSVNTHTHSCLFESRVVFVSHRNHIMFFDADWENVVSMDALVPKKAQTIWRLGWRGGTEGNVVVWDSNPRNLYCSPCPDSLQGQGLATRSLHHLHSGISPVCLLSERKKDRTTPMLPLVWICEFVVLLYKLHAN